MKSITIIITILLICAALSWAASADMAEQDRIAAEYCAMVRDGHWPAYRGTEVCNHGE